MGWQLYCCSTAGWGIFTMDDMTKKFADNISVSDLERMPGGVLIYCADASKKILYANRYLIQAFGCENMDEFLQLTDGSFQTLPHPDDRERVEREIQEQMDNGREHLDFVNYRIIRKDGSVIYVDEFGHRVEIPGVGEVFYVFFVQELLRSRLHESLSTILNTQTNPELDPLTGLLAMRSFLGVMQEQKDAHAAEGGNRLAVLYVDVAGFRQINIRYGLTAGDDFLQTFGRSLDKLFAKTVVSRFDVDHFVILTDAYDLSHKAEIIRSLVKQLAPKDVDCSVGACVWEDYADEPMTVCNRAKAASDDNRDHMNTFFSIYTQKLGEHLSISRYVVLNIDEAISRGWIKVYYQPLIRSFSNELCGMEALARWDDPQRGMLMPMDFIEPLEDAGLIWKLDLCVIRSAVKNIAACGEAGLNQISVSVNLSRIDFLDCDIFGEIEAIMQEYKVSKNLLHIEVTESIVMSKETKIYQTLDRFRNAGYEIWMDDFGSGYSTLNLLKDYHFDVLKLDMVFLRNDTPRSREIIASVVAMDKKIGIRTLAEGVETKEQAEFLMRLGCEKLQGYYYSKPLPYEEIMHLCRSKDMQVEPLNEKPYFDAVSEIDLMSDSRLMSIELRDDAFRVLFCNGDLLNSLQELGVESVDDLEAEFNSGRPGFVRFRDFLTEIKDMDQFHLFDYSAWNYYVRYRVRKIAVMQNRQAYQVEMNILSRNESEIVWDDSLPECTYYEFTDDMLTGNEKIDGEHREIFVLANRAVGLVNDTEYVPEKACDLIHEIMEYMKRHFQDEEVYMEQTHDPILPRQKIQHAQFLQTTEGIGETALEKEEYIQMVNLIVQWLYRHIIGTDGMIGKSESI